MNKFIPTFLLCASAAVAVQAQSSKYWQQQADFTISAELNDQTHQLHAFETIRYTNHSPDTLHSLYFHLWMNAFKTDRSDYTKQAVENGDTKFYFSKKDEKGYIDSLSFMVDGNAATFEQYNDNPDIIELQLPTSLLPGQSITITTPFRVQLPRTFSRPGHEGQDYQVTQWFPKPAVYDHKGWHPMPYLDQGEFYSEFGKYDVSLTVPQNYLVAATGNLQTSSESEWLATRNMANIKGDTAFLNSLGQKKKIASSNQTKTLQFTEDRIHDFAWFASKRYVFDEDTLTLSDGNVVTARAYYFPESRAVWSHAVGYVKNATQYYSKRIGNYAYNHVSVVEGPLVAGAGMEYPTIAIIAPAKTASELKTPVIHEVGHNWFQGMLASNERDFGWMDEGVNSYYEKAYGKEHRSKPNIMDLLDESMITTQLMRRNQDQPIQLHSAWYDDLNYGLMLYSKAPAMIAYLEQTLGRERFDAAMQQYFNTWQFKHPQPEDIRESFEQSTGQDLSWFFDEGLKTTHKIDFAIAGAKKQNDQLKLRLKNKTGFSGPVILAAETRDTSQSYVIPGFAKDTTVTIPVSNEVRSVVLNPGYVAPETNAANNTYRTHALLHRFSWRPRLIGGAGVKYNQSFYFIPSVGYNNYDGFMLGLGVHNLTLPSHKFQFMLAPMYGFNSETFAGTGKISYSVYPNGAVDQLRFSLQGSRFSNYYNKGTTASPVAAGHYKINPGVMVSFRNKDARSKVENILQLKYYYINEETVSFRTDTTTKITTASKGYNDNQFVTLSFYHYNDRTMNPFSYGGTVVVNDHFVKAGLEANFKVNYQIRKKAFYGRVFAGKYWTLNDYSGNYDYRRTYLASTFTGENDYLYDSYFFGRNETQGLWAQQVVMKDGGFKMRSQLLSGRIGVSDDWMVTANIKTDLPFKIPVRIFADFGTFANAQQLNSNGSRMLFDAGLEIYFWDVVNIYFPLLYSPEFKDYAESVYGKNKFWQSVSFTVNLNNIKLPEVSRKRADRFLVTD
jgi:hypothetical protein